MTTELAVPERRAAALTPMQELQSRIISEGNIDALKELMALQERWEANEARAEFVKAFAAFKSEAVRIVKNAKSNNNRYANLFAIVESVTPALSKHGLALSWKLTKDDAQWMEVTATLRHERGHSESVSMGSAPDIGPGRNAIQSRGSAKTYLERYTAMAILGMAAADQDDDVRATSKAEPESFMDKGVARDYLNNIEAATTVDELQAAYFKARDAAEKGHDNRALMAFAEAKNKRFRKLTATKAGAR